MSDVDLTVGRWRWRRNGGYKTKDEMKVHAKDMPPDGTFTDTLLTFTAQTLEVKPGSPDIPVEGTWYKGSVEPDDHYHDPLDNDTSLGTFWAKVYAPTRVGIYSILLFQYKFTATNPSPETSEPPVRTFGGTVVSHDPVTFLGYGSDNWVPTVPNTFTLTQEEWPQKTNMTPS